MACDKEQVTGGPGSGGQLEVNGRGLRVETSFEECSLEGK